MRRPIIIGLIVLAVIGGGFVIFHNPSSAKNSKSNVAKSTNGSAANPSGTGDPVVQTKTSSSFGQYLTDPSGDALYTYGGDSNGVSNCTGTCLSSWPPYVATITTSLPTNVTVIKRSDDGSGQYAYKGMPLYYFANDNTGQITGDGVSGFHLARP